MFKDQNRVIVYTKPGCFFCEVLKRSLVELGVDFDEEEANGVAPIMWVDGKEVFTGLPNKTNLVKFVVDNNLGE